MEEGQGTEEQHRGGGDLRRLPSYLAAWDLGPVPHWGAMEGLRGTEAVLARVGGTAQMERPGGRAKEAVLGPEEAAPDLRSRPWALRRQSQALRRL